MVVNFMAFVWPVARVMQKNLDSMKVRRSQPHRELCFDKGWNSYRPGAPHRPAKL